MSIIDLYFNSSQFFFSFLLYFYFENFYSLSFSLKIPWYNVLFSVAYLFFFFFFCFSTCYLAKPSEGFKAQHIFVTFKKNIRLLITDKDLRLSISAFCEMFSWVSSLDHMSKVSSSTFTLKWSWWIVENTGSCPWRTVFIILKFHLCTNMVML